MTKVKLYSQLGSNGSIGLNARSTIQIYPGLRSSMVLSSDTCLLQLRILGDNSGFGGWLKLPEQQQQFQESPEELVISS